MIHQVSGGAQGQASDVERTVEYMFKLKKRLIKILADHCGQPEDKVKNDSDRDYYMSAAEAKNRTAWSISWSSPARNSRPRASPS